MDKRKIEGGVCEDRGRGEKGRGREDEKKERGGGGRKKSRNTL